LRIKKHKKASGTAPITGIILPSKWNEEGKPARIAIHTDDQKEYQIDFSGAGKELLNLTYKKVAVQGKLREQLNGRAILCVRQYQIITDAPLNSVPNKQAV
jgi:predicted lipoprotein